MDESRLDSESFCKISKHLIDKHSLFAHKEMSFFPSVMINIGAIFLFWLCLLALLCFYGWSVPPNTELELRLCFSLRDQEGTIH